jgi:hypothetical protein
MKLVRVAYKRTLFRSLKYAVEVPFFSPMAARMPVGRVATEGVTAVRTFLLRKESSFISVLH